MASNVGEMSGMKDARHMILWLFFGLLPMLGSCGMGTAGEKQVWNPCSEYLCGDRRPEGTLQGADAAKIS